MFVLLNEKDYQKAKNQIETLNQRKTFLISAMGSIQGIHAWVTLYNNFFECAGGKAFLQSVWLFRQSVQYIYS